MDAQRKHVSRIFIGRYTVVGSSILKIEDVINQLG